MAFVGIEHDSIDLDRRVPGTGGSDFRRTLHWTQYLQNKKYRCAIGSTSAGAQVSSSPSARTS